jgi:hypothetical protein
MSLFRRRHDVPVNSPSQEKLKLDLWIPFKWQNPRLITGYCVYEKKKNREIKNPKQIKLKNGRPAIKGTCAVCGKPIFRIGDHPPPLRLKGR